MLINPQFLLKRKHQRQLIFCEQVLHFFFFNVQTSNPLLVLCGRCVIIPIPSFIYPFADACDIER